MTHSSQVSHHLQGNPFFKRDSPASRSILDTKARPVQGRLGIKFIIHQPHQHLHMALRLHKPTHHAVRGI